MYSTVRKMPKPIKGARPAEYIGLRVPPAMLAWVDEQMRKGEASSRSAYILNVLEIHRDRIEDRASKLMIERSREVETSISQEKARTRQRVL
jgi:Arc/MetJ-type ribon-helix-helix transcriptional regulator